jgi:hypothetical protein
VIVTESIIIDIFGRLIEITDKLSIEHMPSRRSQKQTDRVHQHLTAPI